jgi:ketopantoate reductase
MEQIQRSSYSSIAVFQAYSRESTLRRVNTELRGELMVLCLLQGYTNYAHHGKLSRNEKSNKAYFMA